MKTILRIVLLLIVASVVAGGLFLALNNNSMTSDEGQPPAANNVSDGTFQPMDRPEGGEHEASLAQGASGMLVTIGKLTGIALLVLLLEKGLRLLNSQRWDPAQRMEG